MSVATVVTRGYGSFGSVNKIPTLGYGLDEEVIRNPNPRRTFIVPQKIRRCDA